MLGFFIFYKLRNGNYRWKRPPAIKVKKAQSEKCLMDFVGFKCDSNTLPTTTTTDIDFYGYRGWVTSAKAVQTLSEFDYAKTILKSDGLSKTGFYLQKCGYANDSSAQYFGIFSLQEMELYKSSNRYVTFVEVESSKLYYSENNLSKQIPAASDGGFFGVGVPFLAAGAACYSECEKKGDASPAQAAIGVGAGLMELGTLLIGFALTPTKTENHFLVGCIIFIFTTLQQNLLSEKIVLQ